MAQNLVINNVSYQNVPEIDVPKSGGGTAKFHDVSDASLSSNSQLLDGVTAYGANGTKYTGDVTLPTISQDSTSKILSIS